MLNFAIVTHDLEEFGGVGPPPALPLSVWVLAGVGIIALGAAVIPRRLLPRAPSPGALRLALIAIGLALLAGALWLYRDSLLVQY